MDGTSIRSGLGYMHRSDDEFSEPKALLMPDQKSVFARKYQTEVRMCEHSDDSSDF